MGKLNKMRKLDFLTRQRSHCVYCGLDWISLSSHRKPGSRCGLLAAQDHITKAKDRRRKKRSSKRKRDRSDQKQDMEEDEVPSDSGDVEIQDDFSPPSPPGSAHNPLVLPAITGQTKSFPQDDDDVTPVDKEPPREQVNLPPLVQVDNTTHINNPVLNPKSVPDLGDFLPGSVRHFNPAHRAGQPITPDRYDTPYESWHKEWKKANPGKDDTWAPFFTPMEWHLTKWLKECRIGHGETDRLLQLPKARSIPLITPSQHVLTTSLP